MIRLTNRPAAGNMNTGFGPRPRPTPTSPAIHYGQDYGWGGGDAVYAAAAGVVTSYGRRPGYEAYGNRLVLDHGSGFETWYCHLSSAHVFPGDVVQGGQHVAEMGTTGNVTAKHLHFEVRADGTAVDPEPYFAAAASVGELIPIQEEEDMAQAFITVSVSDGPKTNEQYIIPAAAARRIQKVRYTEGDWLVKGVRDILDGFAYKGDGRVEVKITGQMLDGGLLDLFQ